MYLSLGKLRIQGFGGETWSPLGRPRRKREDNVEMELSRSGMLG